MFVTEVIEPAQTDWASPIVTETKKDGTPRFCVDYPKLNDVSIPNLYSISGIDDLVDSFADSTV